MTPTPSRTTLAYVAGPYRDSRGTHYVSENIWAARGIAAALWQHGFSVLCPHLNTQHLDGLCDDQAFLDGAMEMLRRCDLVVFSPRWHTSAGTRAEIAHALHLGLPLYAFPELAQSLTADYFNLLEITNSSESSA